MLFFTACNSTVESGGGNQQKQDIDDDAKEVLYSKITEKIGDIVIEYSGKLNSIDYELDFSWFNFVYQPDLTVYFKIVGLEKNTEYTLSYRYYEWYFEGNNVLKYEEESSKTVLTDNNGQANIIANYDFWYIDENDALEVNADISEEERDVWRKRHIKERFDKPYFTELGLHDFSLEETGMH